MIPFYLAATVLGENGFPAPDDLREDLLLITANAFTV